MTNLFRFHSFIPKHYFNHLLLRVTVLSFLLLLMVNIHKRTSTQMVWSRISDGMDSNGIARQALDWIPPDFKKKRGRPRVSWTSTIKKGSGFAGSDMG